VVTALGRQAVVVGAGIAGLLAARILADRFERVLVLEKDRLPAEATPRKGVPQGPQVHALVKRGENIIADLFPGFLDHLSAGGAITTRFGADIAVYEGGDWHPRRDPGFTLSTQTRALLEAVIRHCLLTRKNVEIRDGYRFATFKLDRRGAVSAVEGIDVDSGATVAIPADLAIDAMGRGSPTPRWLNAGGFGNVPVSAAGIAINYVTILLNQPPHMTGDPGGWVVRASAPEMTRGATMFAIEDGRWLLTLVSRFGDRPPLSFEECLAFAKTLEVPQVHEWAAMSTLDTAPQRFNVPQALLHHFDAMANFPPRLLPMGDVIGSFNPIQAQGMTVAALHGLCLQRALDDCGLNGGDLDGVAGAYLPEAVAASAGAWRAAVTSDFAYPQTTGERPPDLDERFRFRRAVRELMITDAELHRLAVRVQQMLEPASVLAREDVLARAAVLSAV
jgi:2-polyprenyl-6-methoxyphenol hydroxylase-like FAD-dependent oxidoreductase